MYSYIVSQWSSYTKIKSFIKQRLTALKIFIDNYTNWIYHQVMGLFIDVMSKISAYHKSIDNNNNNIVFYNP